MLKVTFEGNNVAELNEAIADYTANIGGGGTVIEAAGGKKAGAKKEADKPKTVTKEMVQDALVKAKAGAGDPTAAGVKIKDLFADFTCTKVSELEPAEYGNFIEALNKIDFS